jgi:hypothetical protein
MTRNDEIKQGKAEELYENQLPTRNNNRALPDALAIYRPGMSRRARSRKLKWTG